ncbi:hypothetical protein KSW81_000801 [Nannochloris sp. 'desiccata']|nr:hypothetical protein KSW81_000801 [Chlorella desiccata (nom. nud.)]
MFNSSNKLFDQIFELKFTSKQLNKQSQKCESEEKAEKGKAKKAMEKGNMEGAKIYAQNAIRKKSEALNYLQLASRLDAVVSRLDQQAKMASVSKSMAGIVKTLNVALKNAPLDKMVNTMNQFEKQFEDLDVNTAVMDDAMNKQAALSTPPDQVNELLLKIADENNLEVQLPQAGNNKVPAPIAQEGDKDSLTARLDALKGPDACAVAPHINCDLTFLNICTCSPTPPTRPESEATSKAWEELRREARKLEGELDVKIAAYGKLSSSYEYGYTKGESGLSTDQLLQTKSVEINTALARLSDVNSSMSHAITGGADSRAHTLARHRDILHDFTQEYRRLSSIVGAARERADLLGGISGTSSAPLMGGGNTGLLLRERGLLDRSHAAVDQVIGQAQGVAASLTGQRQLFDAIDSKVASIGARFPVVNSLLNAIRRRKNRDNVILAGVMGVCMLLILLYWVNK